MSAVNNDDYKEYLKLVKRFALRSIRNEEQNMRAAVIIPELGSASRVSEFLKGHRRLSIEQAKRLAQRFRLNIASLIEVAD
jgi:antitoxin component HigA of HigAB toxin-antitoxin module